MELTGEQLIAAPRQRVWDALYDPQILRACIPGCEEVVRLSPSVFQAKVLTKIGPLRAHFAGRVEMSEMKPPSSCTLVFEGGAGSVGMARGQSHVTLEDEAGATRLRYAADAAIGGKLGQIGGRLIDASAKKMADDFFRALDRQLNPQAKAPSAAVLPASEAQAALAAAPAGALARAAGFTAGWSGEFQRLFWLLLGGGIGFALGHALPF